MFSTEREHFQLKEECSQLKGKFSTEGGMFSTDVIVRGMFSTDRVMFSSEGERFQLNGFIHDPAKINMGAGSHVADIMPLLLWTYQLCSTCQ
jgi:hypothetical protein